MRLVFAHDHIFQLIMTGNYIPEAALTLRHGKDI